MNRCFTAVYVKRKRLNYLKEFMIPFRGLSLGTHQYDWEIGKKFFEAIENPDILDCELSVKLDLDKQERMMVLNFHISGEIETECDRCLDMLVLTPTINQVFIIKFGNEYLEESEDVLIIPENDYQFDVSGLIFDYISLSLPMKKVHGEDEKGNSLCSGEVLSRLNSIEEEDEVDPRWNALKNLKLGNKQ
jgi:uncharacterized metal-binding protein YceD (DUF177 family)